MPSPKPGPLVRAEQFRDKSGRTRRYLRTETKKNHTADESALSGWDLRNDRRRNEDHNHAAGKSEANLTDKEHPTR